MCQMWLAFTSLCMATWESILHHLGEIHVRRLYVSLFFKNCLLSKKSHLCLKKTLTRGCQLVPPAPPVTPFLPTTQHSLLANLMLLWKIHSTSGSYTLQLIDLIFSNMHSHSNLATLGFPDSSEGKELLQCRRPESSLWAGKIPWRREEQPSPGLLPGESMDRPWGYKESDATERLTFTYCPALTGILTSSVASSHLVFFSPLASILYHSSPLKILLSLHLLFDLMKWSVIDSALSDSLRPHRW